MATRILFDPRQDLPDGTTSSAAVIVEATPTAIRTDGAVVVFPTTQRFTVSSAADPIVLAAPGAGQAWRLVVRRGSSHLEQRTVTWTAADEVAWGDLTNLDPATLVPTPDVTASWAAAIADLQAEIDQLPTTGSGGGPPNLAPVATSAPTIVTPPATLALYGQVGLSAWFWEFSSAGNRFTLDTPTAFAAAALPAGGTGSFELAIYATSKDSGGGFSHARMATSGLVPLSDFTPDGQNQIIVPFQDAPVLPPGEYTLILWCDSNTPQFVHALSNDLKIARLGLGSIYDTGGLPEYISDDFPSGRAFIAALLPVDRAPAGTVVLMGDSITAGQTWFDTANYRVDKRWTAVNQGGPGETTGQMVARFGAALAANPELVVIFGGANDVGQGLDPQTTIGNLASMRDAALAAGARVIMATVTPRGFLAGDASPSVGNAAIAAINAWLRGQNVPDVSLADWHDAMTTGDGVTYRPELFNDHVHPSVRGQRIMASVLSPLL